MLTFHARNLLANLRNDVVNCFSHPPAWWTREDDKKAAKLLFKEPSDEERDRWQRAREAASRRATGPPKITEPWRDWPVGIPLRVEDVVKEFPIKTDFARAMQTHDLTHCETCNTYSRVDEDCACKRSLSSE